MLQTLLEGRLVNLDMPSPAATIALAPTFMRLNHPLCPPKNPCLLALQHAQPDEVTLARSQPSLRLLQTLLEGRLVNLDMTSPAATIALALMFLPKQHKPDTLQSGYHLAVHQLAACCRRCWRGGW